MGRDAAGLNLGLPSGPVRRTPDRTVLAERTGRISRAQVEEVLRGVDIVLGR